MIVLNNKIDKENFNYELNQQQVFIAEKLKTDDNKSIDGEEEENNQFLTEDDIIKEVDSQRNR